MRTAYGILPAETLMPHTLDDLLAIMARLRDPAGGCPWDREQTFATIAPYTIEEAYEVADAIDRGDLGELREELGDLLFQVVFYAQMAREQGVFAFADVVDTLCEKMLRRHPHVFAGAECEGEEALRAAWEGAKARERESKAEAPASHMDGVARALPALTRADKLGRRAARAGLDWPDPAGVLEKCREELAEVEEEIARDHSPAALSAEVGDLLFSCVNLARHLRVDPEQALRHANAKFERRFRALERGVAREGRDPADLDPAEIDERWERVKEEEETPGRGAPG